MLRKKKLNVNKYFKLYCISKNKCTNTFFSEPKTICRTTRNDILFQNKTFDINRIILEA